MEFVSESYLLFVPLVAIALLLFALALSSLGRGEPAARPPGRPPGPPGP